MPHKDLLSDYRKAETPHDFAAIISGIANFEYVLPETTERPLDYLALIMVCAVAINGDTARKLAAEIEASGKEDGQPVAWSPPLESFKKIAAEVLAGQEPSSADKNSFPAIMKIFKKGIMEGTYGYYTLKMHYPSSSGETTFPKVDGIRSREHAGISSRTLSGDMAIMCDIIARIMPAQRLLKAKIGDHLFIEEMWKEESDYFQDLGHSWIGTIMTDIIRKLRSGRSEQPVNPDATSVMFPVGNGEYHVVTPVLSGHVQTGLKSALEELKKDSDRRLSRHIIKIPKPQNCGDYCNSIGGLHLHLKFELPRRRLMSGKDRYLFGRRRAVGSFKSLSSEEFQLLHSLPMAERVVVADHFERWPSARRIAYSDDITSRIIVPVIKGLIRDFSGFIQEYGRLKNKPTGTYTNKEVSAILDHVNNGDTNAASGVLKGEVLSALRRFTVQGRDNTTLTCLFADGPFLDLFNTAWNVAVKDIAL